MKHILSSVAIVVALTATGSFANNNNLVALQEQVATLQQQKVELYAFIDTQHQQLSAEKAKVYELKLSLGEMQNNLTYAQSALTVAEYNLSQAQWDFKVEKKAHNLTKEQVAAHENTISELQSDVADKEYEIAKINKQIDNLWAKYVVKVNHVKELLEKNQALQATMMEKDKTIASLEAKLEDKSAEAKKYHKWWIERKQQAESLKEQLAASEADLEELQDKISDAAAITHHEQGNVYGNIDYASSEASEKKSVDTKVDWDQSVSWHQTTVKADWVLVEGDGYSFKYHNDFWVKDGTQSKLEQAFDDVAESVYTEGYSDGFNDGYQVGFNDGYAQALSDIQQ